MPIMINPVGGRIRKIDPNRNATPYFQSIYVRVNTAYTVNLQDGIVLVTANGLTITLPSAASAVERKFTIKNTYLSSGTTIATVSGQIEGNSTMSLLSTSASVDLYSDGTNYHIL